MCEEEKNTRAREELQVPAFAEAEERKHEGGRVEQTSNVLLLTPRTRNTKVQGNR